MKALYVLVFVCVLSLESVVFAADTVIPNLCYDTVDGTQFCTQDHLGNVQVFVFNAGWCPPCNSEMDELSEAYPEFKDKKVTFASLSGEGFTRGSRPDLSFLKAWQKKHSIPFVVAGKFKDFGKYLGASGSIPYSVVVDKQGNIAKSGFLSASEITGRVRDLLRSN